MQQKNTVLYFDDNVKSRRLLASILEQNGFAVTTAGKWEPSLLRCREIDFDLALLNFRAPFHSGSPLAKELKFIHPDVPIVMISALAAIPEEERIFVDAYFGPGTALDELVATMRMLVYPEFVARRDSGIASPWSDST